MNFNIEIEYIPLTKPGEVEFDDLPELERCFLAYLVEFDTFVVLYEYDEKYLPKYVDYRYGAALHELEFFRPEHRAIQLGANYTFIEVEE